jgi:hypothetical protein
MNLDGYRKEIKMEELTYGDIIYRILAIPGAGLIGYWVAIYVVIPLSELLRDLIDSIS